MEEKETKRKKGRWWDVQRMGRWELADLIWEQSNGMSKEEARHFVALMFELMRTTLLNGQEIRIHRFGTFSLHDRAGHWQNNWKAKRPVWHPRKSYVRFKPWPDLKQVHERFEE